jgi:hypothetical protein
VTTDVEPKDGIWRNQAGDFTSERDLWIVTRWDETVAQSSVFGEDETLGGDEWSRSQLLIVLVDVDGRVWHTANVSLKLDNKPGEDLVSTWF